MIDIYYTKFVKPLPDIQYKKFLNYLPQSLQKKNSKYYRWQDRHSHLFGKLLLLTGLNNLNFQSNILNKICYNPYSRPYINADVDFNISHSGEYVLCAIGKNIRLGIDIEEIRDLNFNDFNPVMTKDQWKDILKSTNSIHAFFKYWTIKESVIKADSRGLSIPLLELNFNYGKVVYDKQIWHLKNLDINNQYCASLATNIEDVNFELKFIDFYNTPNCLIFKNR